MENIDTLIGLGQLVAVVVLAFGLFIHTLSLGKAIGRIEQILEAHHEDIRDLKDQKMDKDTCAALRSDPE